MYLFHLPDRRRMKVLLAVLHNQCTVSLLLNSPFPEFTAPKDIPPHGVYLWNSDISITITTSTQTRDLPYTVDCCCSTHVFVSNCLMCLFIVILMSLFTP